MFLLSNIRERKYRKLYPDMPNVIFDISDAQLKNKKNSDWQFLAPGTIVCVVQKTRKLSTFFRVDEKFKTDLSTPTGGALHVVTGSVAGKLDPSQNMTALLNKHGVSNPYLPNNQFSIGFNLADLGDALSDLQLDTPEGQMSMGELQRLLVPPA